MFFFGQSQNDIIGWVKREDVDMNKFLIPIVTIRNWGLFKKVGDVWVGTGSPTNMPYVFGPGSPIALAAEARFKYMESDIKQERNGSDQDPKNIKILS